MSKRRTVSFLRAGSLLALVLLLAACTKGGQFDPTTLLDNDMFDSKKPLQGQREPVFPNGVPGATNGIPADLYKGYQPPPEPPDQAAVNGEGAVAAAPDAAPPKPEPKAKPKPKPKVARAPAQPHTTISVGLAKKPQPAPEQQARQPQAAQSAWPNPAPAPAVQPAAQSPWPAGPQSGWPNPGGSAPSSQ